MNLAKIVTPFEIRSLNSEERVIEGYASVFGVKDSYGSIFDRGCFERSLREKTPKVLFNHDWNGVPIGKVLEASEDEIGLRVKYKLTKGIQRADETWIAINEGSIDSMSIGFRINTEAIENKDWHIKQVDLFEISPVNFPANEMAVITAFRSLDPRLKARVDEDIGLSRIMQTAQMMRANLLLRNQELSLKK